MSYANIIYEKNISSKKVYAKNISSNQALSKLMLDFMQRLNFLTVIRDSISFKKIRDSIRILFCNYTLTKIIYVVIAINSHFKLSLAVLALCMHYAVIASLLVLFCLSYL